MDIELIIKVDERSSKQSAEIGELSHLINKRRKRPAEYWRTIRLSRQVLKLANIAEVTTTDDPRPYVSVEINGNEIRGLLDSGSTISCMGKDALDTIDRCKIKWKRCGGSAQVANGERQHNLGFADVLIKYKTSSKLIRLFIIPSLRQQLYLGVDFLNAFNLMPQVNELEMQTAEEPNIHILNTEQEARLNYVKAEFPSCEKASVKPYCSNTPSTSAMQNQPSKGTIPFHQLFNQRCGQR